MFTLEKSQTKTKLRYFSMTLAYVVCDHQGVTDKSLLDSRGSATTFHGGQIVISVRYFSLKLCFLIPFIVIFLPSERYLLFYYYFFIWYLGIIFFILFTTAQLEIRELFTILPQPIILPNTTFQFVKVCQWIDMLSLMHTLYTFN